LELFLRTANQFLKYLKDTNIRITNIERDLEKSTKNKELQNLLHMEKSLVYFITSLKSNEILLQKLQHSRYAHMNELDEDLLADVVVETKQAIEMAQVYSDIQAGLMDSFASIISNNLNVVMKQLTSITIILMIPTLVASIYGMNLNNHLENHPYAFFYVVGSSLLIAIIIVLFFRKRNWF
jgi:magnesium transporter